MEMKHRKTFGLLFICVLIAGIGFWYWYKQSACDGVVAYDALRDRAQVIALFQQNLKWLVQGPQYQSYDIEFMLDNRASAFDPINKRNLIFNCYCLQGKIIGFIAHFIKSFYRGYILFIVVDQAYRGKGYAEQLLRHAIGQIAAQGCQVVELVTSIDNESAQRLYHKVGFVETSRDNDVIHFEYRIS